MRDITNKKFNSNLVGLSIYFRSECFYSEKYSINIYLLQNGERRRVKGMLVFEEKQ